ncbi:MAG TPA: hydroxylamine oxidation protein HaoB [Nitrospira sp.]|nr:hydroxylamine oxidation protein HaoB [Nitrospira sp.]
MSHPSGAKTILPSLGIVLVAGGLFFLGWFSYLWFKPAPAPYSYQLVDEGGISKFPNLPLQAWPDLKISKYELRVLSLEKPIAIAYRAAKPNGSSILLNWESLVSEPIGFMGGEFSELATIGTDITQHVPKDALILAWWDISRQLHLLSERETLFTSHLGQPLITPSYWKDRIPVIDEYERQFWGDQGGGEEGHKFEQFVDALSSEPTKGAALLRQLAGSRDAYIVVHPTDLYKVGLLRPDRMEIAFKDFPLTGNVHGLANQVKAWMKEYGYDTYTLQSLSEKVVRAYFLNQNKNGKLLLAQMLPLMNSTPIDFEALQLVHKHGGYWVYKIPAAHNPS